ncbi:MAG: metallophosphoesterase [Nanoarchaeota archaeon]
MNEEILKTIKEKGLLLEKEVFDLISNFRDIKAAQDFLGLVERHSSEKIITKAVLNKNYEQLRKITNKFNEESKNSAEEIFVRLGLNLEIYGKKETIEKKEERNSKFKIFYADTKIEKKIEVSDFTENLKSRYQQLQRILMQRADLSNLISINKINSARQNLSIIGLVKEKRTTKNKNIIIILEDLTGEISILVKQENRETFSKAQELQLDEVVAVKASGNRDLLFTNNIYFPDSHIYEKTKFDEDICVAFLSDVHCGSDRHLSRSFQKFLEWINSEDECAKKIKYLFFLGDNVDGVGIFPGQENFLAIKSIKEQYDLLANYIKKIPKHITIFMCPGQHDATRVAEPQPIIDKKYAASLYEIENLVLVTNPTMVKLYEGKKEFRFLMYHGANIHNFISEVPELREMKAHSRPAKAVCHMLKRRHLAPTHSSVLYIPNAERDPLVISEVPDVLCTGEVHRLDIENYNGVLIITGSCWQARTPFEEKVGNIPDPAKVPVLNLRNRELKIFDFGVQEEINDEY